MKDMILKVFNITDKKTLKLLHKTNIVSFFVCILGILLLYIHINFFISFDLLDISIIVFRSGLFIGIFALMSAYIINKYKEEN